MKEKIFKSSVMEIKSSDEDNREVIAIASKETTDRDGDIVRVDGIDIKEYKKNPVVLFAHDHSSLPIARATKIWKDNKNLMVKMQFTTPEENSVGDTVYKLIKGDYLKTLSIGFRPNWDTAVRMEKTGGWDFKDSNLYEISIVPVPANANATVQSKSLQKALDDKVIDDLELQEIELYLKDLIGEQHETQDVEEETEQTIETLTKEEDPYSWVWDIGEVENKDKDKDILEMLYDLLDLNDSE